MIWVRLICLFVFWGAFGQKSPEKLRIVTLNGAITEMVCALGHQSSIVGTDVTSTFPADLQAKDLGHVRSLSVESVMALKPTLILATEKDMNPDLAARLKASGIPTHIFKQEYSISGTKQLLQEVAKVLKVTDVSKVQKAIDKALAQVKPKSAKPKVLFIYARGAGTLMVAGANTPVDRMIALAGGQNAASGIEDFKPLTPEALLANNPDYILFFDKGLQSLGGIEGALKIEGLSKIKAAKNRAIISMDGALLSGFGPRVGEGVLMLHQLIFSNAP
ncbi:MAG: hemin ABC transporter substrate-binding protein [Flavobacterium sp.]